MSWDKRENIDIAWAQRRDVSKTPPQGVKEEKSCKVLEEVWTLMYDKSQRGAIAVMKMKRKVDFRERTICVKYNSLKLIKTLLSLMHSLKVFHTAMSLGYPPVVGEAGQVEAKPYSEDILSVHRKMNYGDIATLLHFQRIPQEASEPSRWDCGGRNRVDNVNGICGKEPSPE